METIRDFFTRATELKEYLADRSGRTVHTADFKETVASLHADWKASAQPQLAKHVDEEAMRDLNRQFKSLFDESRKSRPNRSDALSFLKTMETLYLREVLPLLRAKTIRLRVGVEVNERADQIDDPAHRDYLEEAVHCLQAEANRGAIVLGWQAVMYALYTALQSTQEDFHIIYEKKFGTAPPCRVDSFWDYQKIKDSNILIAAEAAGVLDKSFKDILEEKRTLRNKAAHPGEFQVGPRETEAFLEAIISVHEFLEDHGEVAISPHNEAA